MYDKMFKSLMAKENQTIFEHTEKLVSQAKLLFELGYIKEQNLFDDLVTSCEYHDCGKFNSAFQERINKKIIYNKTVRFNPDEEVPHNVLSVFFIDESKCHDYSAVFYSVLYHHYRKNAQYKNYIINNFDKICKFFEEKDLKAPDRFDTMLQLKKNSKLITDNNLNDLEKKYAVLLKGLLHKCDYSASAGITCEYPNDFLVESLNNWQKEKSIKLEKLQEFCLENSEHNIIATAPTGMGKTEAGLLWCGDTKCFFVLPLKTAINAMYERIKKMSGDGFKERVGLIHSDMRSYYYNDSQKNESDEFDLSYYERSKQMSLPVTVCTPDQIFDFVLKYAGYEYKLATASYSKFIIDEIQMYSPDLLASIIYAIEIIHNMGGKFAILTATLPPFVRAELGRIFGNDVVTSDFSAYGNLRHNVKVFEDTLNSEFIYSTVESIKSESNKKFLVVCNSIDTAQEIYDNLKEKYDNEMEINLFHANFIKRDRNKKEKEILKASNERKKTEIWISTSVVEASLDIDFDILFTELSDLFSLFQRFGRVNRKGKKDFSYTNCYVFTELQGNAKKYGFVDKTIYECSKKAVLTIDGIISEQEKSQLIDTYLSVENIKDSKYIEEYRNVYKYIKDLNDYEKDTSEQLRNIDKVDVIPRVVYDENKQEIEKKLAFASDKNLSDTEKLKAKMEANEFIKSLTVSVSRYYTKRAINNIFIQQFNLSVFEYCDYTFEKGLVINKEDFKKNVISKYCNNADINESDFENFIF